jgi:hypothetical protein
MQRHESRDLAHVASGGEPSGHGTKKLRGSTQISGKEATEADEHAASKRKARAFMCDP